MWVPFKDPEREPDWCDRIGDGLILLAYGWISWAFTIWAVRELLYAYKVKFWPFS